MKAIGYAAQSATSELTPFQFERRQVGAEDVHIEILYCGICHTDIHLARNEWNRSKYPIVPGHEIVGKVIQVGDKVGRFKVGQYVGVGCFVDSCQTCHSCQDNLEQYCEQGLTLTYNGLEKQTGKMTYGGYSDSIVVKEKFVLAIPEKLASTNIKAIAPLLCAGITTYSPLRQWKVKKDDRVAIIGLGGLGHMAVKFAHAIGAHVTVLTTSVSKKEEAKRLGADEVIVSTHPEEMTQHQSYFDFILNTVPRSHDINPYLLLLKRDATMVMVGALDTLEPGINGAPLIYQRRRLAGSLIGGIKETQEMLEFCSEHNIFPDVEMIAIQDINEAYDRTVKNDVRYRFVIDMASLKGTSAK
jgi:alcohol dehydrogenase (NADP+)